MKNKQKLLDLPMNKLGLGGAFNAWFFNEKIQQSDVLNLSEFISLNSSLKTTNEVFICWRNNEIKKYFRVGLIKTTVSFKKLKSFLINQGFNHNDWILLLPEIKALTRTLLDLSLVDKKDLLELPYYKVTNTKRNCRTGNRIQDFFIEKEEYSFERDVLVKDILSLTDIQLKSCFPKQMLKKTFVFIQKKFTQFGLTEKDGPFMKANLSN